MPQIVKHDFLDSAGNADRVLVVVFLRGGADGLTLVPPTGDDGYYRARPVLAVKKSDAIALDGYFSLNSSLKPLMKHLEAGTLAIVHGAGSEDTTRSHFEAQDFMEHGGSDGSGGWLGRYLRARPPNGNSPSALAAVAIGTTLPESLRGAPGGAVMQTLRDFSVGEDDESFIEELGRLYAVQAGPLGQAAHDTIQAVRRLRDIRATDEPPDRVGGGGARYPDSPFGRGLREIARLIKADVGLVASTINLEGWDTHFVQQQLITSLMADLAGGLDAFLADLGEHRQRVNIVTMTEFGRRVHENTSFGTDHGAGSVMFVFGPGIEGGGQVRSGWSGLADDRLIGPGDVPATINYRDVLGPILLGHSPSIDLRRIFPGFDFDPASAVGAAAHAADHGCSGPLRGCTC